ncbi:MAG: GNAT family N-acetyltransferase [Pseudomonadota bacterium]
MGAAVIAQPIPTYIPRVTYRAARSQDARALVKLRNIGSSGLEACAWQEEAQPGESFNEVGTRTLRRIGSDPNCHVAEIDGAPIGTVSVVHGPKPADSYRPELHAGELFVECVAVHSQWESHGVGARLIGWAEAMARNAGHSRVIVRVFTDNARAVRLFERLGYQETTQVDIGPNPMIPFSGPLAFMAKTIR